jgi:hypothetical protein
VDLVKEMHDHIVKNRNIIRVGLTNIDCGIMSDQFSNELPDAVSAMFKSYNISVSLYVRQFPDWVQFTNNAFEIDLDDNDKAIINHTALEVISSLNQEISDPDVPKIIEYIRSFMMNPKTASKRAIYAMIKTIENLLSGILRYGLDFANKTIKKFVDIGSSVMAIFLALALATATGIGPIAASIGAPWVSQSIPPIIKLIETIKPD